MKHAALLCIALSGCNALLGIDDGTPYPPEAGHDAADEDDAPMLAERRPDASEAETEAAAEAAPDSGCLVASSEDNRCAYTGAHLTLQVPMQFSMYVPAQAACITEPTPAACLCDYSCTCLYNTGACSLAGATWVACASSQSGLDVTCE